MNSPHALLKRVAQILSNFYSKNVKKLGIVFGLSSSKRAS